MHQGNFRQTGFVERPGAAPLAELAHAHGVTLIEDLGGGAMVDLRSYGLSGEPTARAVVESGVDVVCFSTDKLLGGPQEVRRQVTGPARRGGSGSQLLPGPAGDGLHNLAIAALPAAPPTFAEVAAAVEQLEGVRFAALVAGLPARFPDGDAAIAAVWERVQPEKAKRDQVEQGLGALSPALAAAFASGAPAQVRAALEQLSPREQQAVMAQLEALAREAGVEQTAGPDMTSVLRELPALSPASSVLSSPAMPPRDFIHDAVRKALEREGWTITDDPLRLKVPGRCLYVDLGAEHVLAAERGAVTIAVEIKTFGGPSDVRDLEDALGQYNLYDLVLRRLQPQRQLFLAVPLEAWEGIFAEALGQMVVSAGAVHMLVVDPEKEVIIQWIPSTPGETPSSAS